MSLAQNCYTYLGKTLYVHPTVATPSEDVDPTQVQLAYYAKLPPLAEADSADAALRALAEALHLRGAVAVGTVPR